MSPTASHTGRRADDRRPAEPRRGTEIKRTAQEYERELRRQELAIARSLTSVLPTDRPARMRELVEARRVMSGAVRDLQRLARDLEADLGRYSALRSHTQRDVLAYEAVAGEIEEVLLRWEARLEQLSATVERGNRRQGRGEGRPTTGAGRPGGAAGRPTGAGGPGGAAGRPTTGGGRTTTGGRREGRNDRGGDRNAGRDRAGGDKGGGPGGQGRTGGREPGGRPAGGRRGGPGGRSAGGGGRPDPRAG